MVMSEKDIRNLNWIINVWNRLRRGGDVQTTPSQMEYLENWMKNLMEKLQGNIVNVDEVRDDFVNEVYSILDADSTTDRANLIIEAFDSLPTVTI
jgi:hypothetical protein